MRGIARLTKTGVLAAALASLLVAQPEPANKRFEVASVREHQGNVFRSGPLRVADPLIRLEGYTIYGLVMDAWNLRDFQLKISPDIPRDDVYNKMYDIVARAAGSGVPSVDDVRTMLQNLLADRFKIAVHHEAHEMPVYVMQVGKSGLKLQAGSASGPCQVHTGLAADGRNDEEIFTDCPLERLADRLRGKFDGRPILDKTGLTGVYNMRLVALARSRQGPDPTDIDPSTAIRDMGLTLTPAKASVDVLSVDRLEKLTEN